MLTVSCCRFRNLKYIYTSKTSNDTCDRGASEPWSWLGGRWGRRLMNSAAFLLQPWASLPSVLPTPHDSMLLLTAHLSAPRTNLIVAQLTRARSLTSSLLSHCCLIMSDYCLILLSVSICLSPSLCLTLPFTLRRGDGLWKHRDKGSFWNDGHYCSRGPIITSFCHLSLSCRQDFKA